jgi:hypothetical protein
MNISGAEAGVIGVVLFFVLAMLDKYTSLFKFMKGGNNQNNKAIENNTTAIVELTNFLRTQAEVDKEKDKQYGKQMDNIEGKIDKLMDMTAEHNTKCSVACHKGGNNL